MCVNKKKTRSGACSSMPKLLITALFTISKNVMSIYRHTSLPKYERTVQGTVTMQGVLNSLAYSKSSVYML